MWDLRVNDSLDGVFRASYTPEDRSCRLRIRSLIICRYRHLPPLDILLVRLRRTPLAASREISRFVSDRPILHRLSYSREVRAGPLLGARSVFIRDRSLEALGLGSPLVALVYRRPPFRVLMFLLAFTAGRVLAAAVLPLAAGPQAAALLVLAGRQILLLVFHAAILEPDLHLLLRQTQIGRDLDPAQPRQIHVRGELALQF